MKLLPCPFCQDPDVSVRETTSMRDTAPIYVHCDACGADGPQHEWAEDAVNAWNTREEVKYPDMHAAYEAWCPYRGSPDPWQVWQSAFPAGYHLGTAHPNPLVSLVQWFKRLWN